MYTTLLFKHYFSLVHKVVTETTLYTSHSYCKLVEMVFPYQIIAVGTMLIGN